ncbi:MAG: BsuPI-related putative proteinase inhibitor [Acidobacteria bacterium]|nr:BsuPI-related putative proteinase inhibitor [Acidobacteriota bacterium]
MKQRVFLFLFSVASLLAQVPDYFPLVPGSTWVYRSLNGASPLSLRIGEQKEISGQSYHRLEGYANSPVLIRQSSNGNFYQWDELKKAEVPFLLFDTSEFPSGASDCQQKGRAEEKPFNYKGPLGSSDTAKLIRYSGGICADTGLRQEVFVPYLGMVQRSETSFIGERTLDLVYAQIGGITYIKEANIGFSLSLTPLRNQIAAKIVLTNTTDRELLLQFNSGQTYNFVIRNDRNETVYFWSADKLFPAVQRQLSVRGEEVWQENLPASGLSPGIYSVEASLVNSDGRKFSATASISLP